MHKKEVARILDEIGTLLELTGESPFKSRAYYTAARVISGLDASGLQDLVHSGGLRTLKGIGAALAEKITELVTTDHLGYYEALQQTVPAGLLEMLAIPGMGPKKVKAIYDHLGITTVGELEYACHENRLVDLPGFGRKTQANLVKGIERLKQHRGQFLCHEGLRVAEVLREALADSRTVLRVALAGSLRRRDEIVRDIVLLASSRDGGRVMEMLPHLPLVEEVRAGGPTQAHLSLKPGIAADLYVVTDAEFPFALHHLTGSQAHHTAVRRRAKERGYELTEHGLFRGDERVCCRDEEELFGTLGLRDIPPELREDMGEIEAAERGELPALIEERDIQGVLHVHSTWSDGVAEIEEMARTAQRLGYRYLGLSDHSQAARYAHGLDPERVRQQHAVIDRVNAQLNGLTILKGSEVDILPDGSLDYPDDLLCQLDFVVASVHSRFSMPQAEMTARIVKAMHNPYVTMLGHVTGRLLLARDGYAVDLETIIEEAGRLGVVIELNANPHRLDLDWRHLRTAYAHGVMISINPDAHSPEGLQDVAYGVGVARKGWTTAEHVLNTRGLEDLRTWLVQRRRERSQHG
ncbi:MAG: DNA polymerase/3'-5' exonuclease PolX, partial [Nitrospinae bacterium]|nr:DNA polymerase/3'-5' exonuclease PolX [Nitrospinota bacterium]